MLEKAELSDKEKRFIEGLRLKVQKESGRD
jgi:hypothetical protein